MKYMLKTSKFDKVVTTMKVTVLCNETFSMSLTYISSYLFPPSVKLSNFFCIIFLLFYSCFLSAQINFT